MRPLNLFMCLLFMACSRAEFTKNTSVNRTIIKLGIMSLESGGKNTWIDWRFVASGMNCAIEDFQKTGALSEYYFK